VSLNQSLWSSWTVRGYWLHVYRSVARADFDRRYLALESDRSGKTWRLLSWRT
jgi:hypothetical protein